MNKSDCCNAEVEEDCTCSKCWRIDIPTYSKQQLDSVILQRVYPYVKELTRILKEANREKLLDNIKVTISMPTVSTITGTMAGVKFEITQEDTTNHELR